MDAALKALAEPHRREVLRILGAGEQPAGEIAAHFTLTRPAVSQHLRVLREAGLIDERRDGTRRLYRARRESLDEVAAYLGRFWDDRLEALKREAERDERASDGER